MVARPISRLSLDRGIFAADFMSSYDHNYNKARQQYLIDFPRMSVCKDGQLCNSAEDVPRQYWHWCTQATLALPLIVISHVIPFHVLDSSDTMHVDIWQSKVYVKKLLHACDPSDMRVHAILRISIQIDAAVARSGVDVQYEYL